LYLCTQQDSWDKYSRKSAWRVRPAVRARYPLTDTNSQGDLYTRSLNRTAHSSLSLTKFSPHDSQLMHKKAARRVASQETFFSSVSRGLATVCQRGRLE